MARARAYGGRVVQGPGATGTPSRGMNYPANNVGFDPFAGLFGGTATAQQALSAMPVPKPRGPGMFGGPGLRGLVNNMANFFNPSRQLANTFDGARVDNVTTGMTPATNQKSNAPNMRAILEQLGNRRRSYGR